MMKPSLSTIQYIFVFILARGVLFLSPIVLASLLDPKSYSTIEWAYATGTIISTIAIMGTSSNIPVVILTNHQLKATIQGIRIHHLAISVGCCIAAIIAWNVNKEIALPFLFASAICLQSIISIELKSNGFANKSLTIDAALFFLIVFFSWISSKLINEKSEIGAELAAASIFILGTYKLLGNLSSSKNDLLEWKSSVLTSIPLMLTALTSTIITTSGRATAIYFLNDTLSASYSILTRGAAIPIIAHQIIIVSKFKSLFSQNESTTQKITIHIILIVSICSLLFTLTIPWFSHFLGETFHQAAKKNRDVASLLAAQSILWSAISINELLAARHNITAKVLPSNLIGLLISISLALLILLINEPTLLIFTLAYSVIMFTFYVIQCVSLASNKVQHYTAWISALLLYITACAIALTVENGG